MIRHLRWWLTEMSLMAVLRIVPKEPQGFKLIEHIKDWAAEALKEG